MLKLELEPDVLKDLNELLGAAEEGDRSTEDEDEN